MGKDKRALKVAKKNLGNHKHVKMKCEEMSNEVRMNDDFSWLEELWCLRLAKLGRGISKGRNKFGRRGLSRHHGLGAWTLSGLAMHANLGGILGHFVHPSGLHGASNPLEHPMCVMVVRMLRWNYKSIVDVVAQRLGGRVSF
ncbi:hypothetical protein SUGI_0682000 [Cryptomeria japonica]|nr:hypothetical protein SUGI_0682000 [Cryptomeria japonica]